MVEGQEERDTGQTPNRRSVTMQGAEEYFKGWISDGDWVTFKLIEGDKTFIEKGKITFPNQDDWDEGVAKDMVYILNEDLAGYDGCDGEWPEGKPIHRNLIEERLGDHNWEDDRDREDAEDYELMKRDAWDAYRRR